MLSHTKLALAAAFNGVILDSMSMSDANIKATVQHELTDWFDDKGESLQFDRETVVRDISRATPKELQTVLKEIGFELHGDDEHGAFTVNGEKWHAFIDQASAASTR